MKNRSTVIARTADIVLVIAAVTMLGMYASRRSGPRLPLPQSLAPKDWQKEVTTGIRIGPPNAKLTIIEFMDFQCPFCAKWAARVDSVIEQVPTEVRVVFHHFPLSAIHAHALPAAIAAECADQQGIFPAFKKEVFHRQNEIGVTHWRDFAMEAKIPNITRFEQCIAMPTDSFPRIAHGLKLAADHRMTGTPTVWVNGQVSQPSTTALIEMARGASK